MTIQTANSQAIKRFNRLMTTLIHIPPSDHYSFEIRLKSPAILTIVTPHGIRVTFAPYNGDYLNMSIHITDVHRSDEWTFVVSSNPKPESTVSEDSCLPLLYNLMKDIPRVDDVALNLSRNSVVNMLHRLIPDVAKQIPIRRY